MKILINYTYGGYLLPDDVLKKAGFVPYEGNDYLHYKFGEDKESRTYPPIIEAIELYPELVDDCSIAIVEIPDDVSDWMINEYDGYEEVIYVIDGKLHRCFVGKSGTIYNEKQE